MREREDAAGPPADCRGRDRRDELLDTSSRRRTKTCSNSRRAVSRCGVRMEQDQAFRLRQMVLRRNGLKKAVPAETRCAILAIFGAREGAGCSTVAFGLADLLRRRGWDAVLVSGAVQGLPESPARDPSLIRDSERSLQPAEARRRHPRCAEPVLRRSRSIPRDTRPSKRLAARPTASDRARTDPLARLHKTMSTTRMSTMHLLPVKR